MAGQLQSDKFKDQSSTEVGSKLANLLEHPLSCNQIERQLEYFEGFLKLCPKETLILQDIPLTIRIFEAVEKKIEEYPQFTDCLKKLLIYSQHTPILSKASDIFNFARDLEEYFSTLGYLMICFRNKELKILVYDVVFSLLRDPQKGINRIPLDKIGKCIENSYFPEVVAQLLQLFNDDFYSASVKTALLLAKNSKINCLKMAKQNAINFLLMKLSPNLYSETSLLCISTVEVDSYENFDEIIQILWLLLNSIDETVEVPTASAFYGINCALRLYTIDNKHKIERNNILVILLKIFMSFPTVEPTTVLIYELLKLNTIPISDGDIFDYKFKLLITACLSYLKKSFTELESESVEYICCFNIFSYFEECNVTPTFFEIIQYNYENFKEEDNHNLKRMVLLTIPKVMHNFLVEDFVLHNGPKSLIEMKNICRNDQNLFLCYLRCLSEILSCEIETLNKSFRNFSQFFCFLSVGRTILENTSLSANNQISIIYCINILEYLYEKQKNKFISEFCIKIIKRIIKLYEIDLVIDDTFIIFAIHFTWTIFECNFDNFIRNDGIYYLLDLLYMYKMSFRIKQIALGFLVDISSKSASIPYLITWRNKGTQLLTFLLELYRENSEILKPKIYGILYFINNKHRKVTEIANEQYKIMIKKDDLNCEDQLTLLLAENFLSMELGQAWVEVAAALQPENVELIAEDYHLLKTMVEGSRKLAFYLKTKEEEILKRELKLEEEKEYSLYKRLNETRLSQALEALSEIRYIAKCSERLFRVRKSMRKTMALENAMSLYAADIHQSQIHRTPDNNLLVSNMFMQALSLSLDEDSDDGDQFDV